MTFREMRRLSFLRFLDEFFKGPPAVIMVVFFKLVGLCLALFLTRELFEYESVWTTAKVLFYKIWSGGEDLPT